VEERESGSAFAEVRMRVFDGLTKHPRDAPMFLSVLHRKGRSER
jgi:hypothetical protein